jgi:ribosomal protein L11 methyltransferase
MVWENISLRKNLNLLHENIRSITNRAISEASYRQLLLHDPDRALDEYDLPGVDRSAIIQFALKRVYSVLGNFAAYKLIPIQVGKRILIVPTQFDAELESDKLIIRINQNKTGAIMKKDGTLHEKGIAFGAGIHPTTRLSLIALEKFIKPGMSVLDLGTGSGILAITAAKLGAKMVHAIDVDNHSIKIAKQNAKVNKVDEIIKFDTISIEDFLLASGQAKFDIIVMNIFPNLLLKGLRSGLKELLLPGGMLFSSGSRIETVEQARNALDLVGLELINQKELDGWVTLYTKSH